MVTVEIPNLRQIQNKNPKKRAKNANQKEKMMTELRTHQNGNDLIFLEFREACGRRCYRYWKAITSG
jgi:hypothetical protein